nr:MAG TPA: hypothetical protein [Caudoviricetes sp.]
MEKYFAVWRKPTIFANVIEKQETTKIKRYESKTKDFGSTL